MTNSESKRRARRKARDGGTGRDRGRDVKREKRKRDTGPYQTMTVTILYE